MGTTPLGLHPNIKVLVLQIVGKLGPDSFDIAIVAGGFL
jgi:hypothetical protein